MDEKILTLVKNCDLSKPMFRARSGSFRPWRRKGAETLLRFRIERKRRYRTSEHDRRV